jgi:hypothetical protein
LPEPPCRTTSLWQNVLSTCANNQQTTNWLEHPYTNTHAGSSAPLHVTAASHCVK